MRDWAEAERRKQYNSTTEIAIVLRRQRRFFPLMTPLQTRDADYACSALKSMGLWPSILQEESQWNSSSESGK